MRLSGGKSRNRRVGWNYFLNDSFNAPTSRLSFTTSGNTEGIKEKERENFEFSFFLRDGVKNSWKDRFTIWERVAEIAFFRFWISMYIRTIVECNSIIY